MKEFKYVIKDEHGYEDVEPEKTLERLSKRVCQYSDGEICFPHEIGAFLDYPIDDVKCFIEKDGKEADAKRIFAVMGLAVKCGQEITLKTDGENEEEAMNKLSAFLEENL